MDWKRFLDQHGIAYRERGPSTSRDNVYVHCPLCGNADQGQHLGISLKGHGWGCWRSPAHRGRSSVRLIQALLGVSWAEAAKLAGLEGPRAISGNKGLLEAVQAALGSEPSQPGERDPLALPGACRPLAKASAPLFRRYLAERRPAYGPNEIDWLALEFDLHYCMVGSWAYRLVIPITDERHNLMTWTGRSIADEPRIRYKTLTTDLDKAEDGVWAKGPITDYLLGLPWLFEGGKFLVLCEGPFDAMNLSLFGSASGGQATCLFGKAISPAQIDWLVQLKPRYKAIYLLLDEDAALDMLSVNERLVALGVRSVFLKGGKDPGDLKYAAASGLMAELAQSTGRG